MTDSVTTALGFHGPFCVATAGWNHNSPYEPSGTERNSQPFVFDAPPEHDAVVESFDAGE